MSQTVTLYGLRSPSLGLSISICKVSQMDKREFKASSTLNPHHTLVNQDLQRSWIVLAALAYSAESISDFIVIKLSVSLILMLCESPEDLVKMQILE